MKRLGMIVLGVGAAAVVIAFAALFAVMVWIGGVTSTGLSGRGDPAWSPDGGQLAYVRYDSTGDTCKSSIWVEGADGRNARLLIEGGEHPDWSPDGMRIAFTALEYGDRGLIGGSIAVMNADGSHVRRLLSRSDIANPAAACITGTLNDPDWSPDGRLIAFSDRSRPERPGIFTIRPDGNDLRRITDGDDAYPDWSPDGRQLVFRALVRGCYPLCDSERITVMDFDTGTREVLFTLGFLVEHSLSNGSRPIWSPDGTRIAFAHRLPDDIFELPTAGGRAVALTRCNFVTEDCLGHSSPAFSPDGRLLAFTEWRGGGSVIRVEEVAGIG